MSLVTCRPFFFSNTTTKGLCCTGKTGFYVTWHKSRSKIKVLWQQRQQRHSSSVSRTLNGNLFAITQIINIPKVKTLMARKSPRIAESVIKAESQTEECDAGFINLKVKQQVLFIHIWISIYIFHCMQDGAIVHFRIKRQGLMKKVVFAG